MCLTVFSLTIELTVTRRALTTSFTGCNQIHISWSALLTWLSRDASESRYLPFIALQLSLSKSTSLLSFLSLEAQLITMGMFNLKLKCDGKNSSPAQNVRRCRNRKNTLLTA